MTAATSVLILYSADDELAENIGFLLAPHGWVCRRVGTMVTGLDEAGNRPAIVLVDRRMPQADAFAAEIRQMPVPVNATPIMTLGAASAGPRELELPLAAEALLAMLRQWAGPLDDHALRSEPWNFRYRLVRLLGLSGTDEMLLRLRDGLADAVVQVAQDRAAVPAHRLAGLAGICGFPEVSQVWARVDRGEAAAVAEAIDLSRAAAAEIDRVVRSAAT